MQFKNGSFTFYASTRKQWRTWLMKNSDKEKHVWLLICHKNSKTPSVYYEEAVEEALCFGWIDSTPKKNDHESRYQYFAPRKPTSTWSKLNRERAEKLIANGQMMPSGQATIDLARKTGRWIALEEIQSRVIPHDLQKAFDRNKTAFKNFSAFPPSSKKIILGWIAMAKTDVTRKKRIKETIEQAAKNIRANHYKPK
jgi:uncharacterized protein YdeI (YjbR/CyaY-like superfamily)